MSTFLSFPTFWGWTTSHVILVSTCRPLCRGNY